MIEKTASNKESAPRRYYWREVVILQTDAVWRAFAETGDPLCYMLYKSVQRKGRPKDDKDKGEAGDMPRPGD